MSNDCISRQALIEHLRRTIEASSNDGDYSEGFNDGMDFAASFASTLPSAQPDWGKPIGIGRPLADSEIISRLQDIKRQIGGSYAIDRAIEVLEGLRGEQDE